MDYFVDYICKETGCSVSQTTIELEGVEECVNARCADEHIYDHASDRQLIQLYEEPAVQVLHPLVSLPVNPPEPTQRCLNDLSISWIRRYLSWCVVFGRSEGCTPHNICGSECLVHCCCEMPIRGLAYATSISLFLKHVHLVNLVP